MDDQHFTVGQQLHRRREVERADGRLVCVDELIRVGGLVPGETPCDREGFVRTTDIWGVGPNEVVD